MKQRNELDTLEHNINFWKKVVKIQEQKIKEEVFYFPISWTEYLHAKDNLKELRENTELLKFGRLGTCTDNLFVVFL